jgi:hypothetical protein
MDGESSPNHGLRTDRATTQAADDDAEPGRGDAQSKVHTRRTLWADLLRRVFEVDALCCPRCGGRMRVLAAITEAHVARRIMACLNLPTRAPPLARSRPGGRTPAWPEREAPIPCAAIGQRADDKPSRRGAPAGGTPRGLKSPRDGT